MFIKAEKRPVTLLQGAALNNVCISLCGVCDGALTFFNIWNKLHRKSKFSRTVRPFKLRPLKQSAARQHGSYSFMQQTVSTEFLHFLLLGFTYYWIYIAFPDLQIYFFSSLVTFAVILLNAHIQRSYTQGGVAKNALFSIFTLFSCITSFHLQAELKLNNINNSNIYVCSVI